MELNQRRKVGTSPVVTTLVFLLILEANRAAPAAKTSASFDYSGACQPPLFGCDTGICIPSEWVCDGMEDCQSGEDEFCASTITSGRVHYQHVKKRDSDDIYLNKPSLLEDALRLIHEAEIASLEARNLHKREDATGLETLSMSSNSQSTATIFLSTTEDTDQNSGASAGTSLTSLATQSITDVSTGESVDSTMFFENPEQITSVPSVNNTSSSVSPNLGSAENISTSQETSEILTSASQDTPESSITLFSSVTPVPSSVPFNQETPLSSASTDLNTTENTTTTDSMSTISVPTLIESKLLKLHRIAKELITIKKHLEEKLDHLNSTTACSTPPGSVSTATEHYGSISKTTCLPNFLSMDGHCIYIQIYPPESWYTAAKICHSQNGHLISIPSKKVFENLLNLLGFDKMRIYDFWVGASNLSYQTKWVWQDGELVKDKNMWRFGPLKANIDSRSSFAKPDYCGFMDGKLFSYINSAHCLEHKGFICQAPPLYRKTTYE